MGKVTRSVDGFVKYLSYCEAAMGVIGLTIMIWMITVDVVLRYVFGRTLKFVDEYGAYIFIVMVFMGLAYCARVEGHIKVDLIVRRLSRRVRDGLDILTSLGALVLVSVYFKLIWDLFVVSVREGRRSPTPVATPMWIPLSFMWVGLITLGLEVVVRIVKKSMDFREASKKEAESTEALAEGTSLEDGRL